MARGDVYDSTVILLQHGHGSVYSVLLNRMAVHPSVGSINLILRQPWWGGKDVVVWTSSEDRLT